MNESYLTLGWGNPFSVASEYVLIGIPSENESPPGDHYYWVGF